MLSYQKQYGSWSEIQAESQVWRARLKCQHLGGKGRRPMPSLGPGLSIQSSVVRQEGERKRNLDSKGLYSPSGATLFPTFLKFCRKNMSTL